MGHTLGHPTAPGVEYPVQGILIGAGGDGVGGKDRLALPVADHIFDAATGLWVPSPGSAAGGSTVTDVYSVAQLQALANLLSELVQSGQTLEAALAAVDRIALTGGLLKGVDVFPDRSAANEAPVATLAQRQGIPLVQDFGVVASGVMRKYVGIDAGAYVSPVAAAAVTDTQSTITYTGLNLIGLVGTVFDATDRTFHTVMSVTNPAGAVVGNIVVQPAIKSASAVLRIPYSSMPHAYEGLTDAMRNRRIDPEWGHYVAPVQFINFTAVVGNGCTQSAIPAIDYGRMYLEVNWSNAGTSTQSFNVFGKLTTAAWGAAADPTNQPAHYNINNLIQWTTGSTAAGAQLATGRMFGRLQDPGMFSEILVEVITQTTGGNTTMSAWYGLSGNGR